MTRKRNEKITFSFVARELNKRTTDRIRKAPLQLLVLLVLSSDFVICALIHAP